MEFGLSQEQVQLKDSLARLLKDAGGLDRARTFATSDETRADDLIEGLAGLGIAGLIVPEAHGGVGMSFLDAALVAECMGYAVAPVPFIGSSILARSRSNSPAPPPNAAVGYPGLRQGKSFLV